MSSHILDLKQDQAALVTQASAIYNKLQSEKRTKMTAEEDANLTDIESRVADIKSLIERREKFGALAGNAIADNNTSQGGAIAVGRDNFLDKPFGPDKRSGESARQKKARLEYGFGEQLKAIRTAAIRPDRADPRLYELNQRGVALGASEAVPADGGFLVHPDFSDEIMQIAHDTGVIFNRCRKVPLSETSNGIKIPGIDEQSRADGSRWGGVRMFWQNEADATTASKPKLRMIELTLKKLMGLFYSTDELEADARALGSVVSSAFGEEVGFKLDDGVLNGTGAGQLLGILNSAALVTVAKETGQTNLTILFQNVVKMWARLHAKSRKNAVWFLNQDVEQQLLQMALSVGAGGSSVVTGVAPTGPAVYTPAGFNGNETGMLFGRPVFAVEQANTLSSVGDIVLFDPTQYVYIDKGDVQQATSMHVAFLTDQMAYRWIYRVDGQPIWHTALTPFKGTNTQSPYVTLAAR